MRRLSHKATRGIGCRLLGPLLAGAQWSYRAAVLPENHYGLKTAAESEPAPHGFLLCCRGSANLGIEK
jgi:hypothetical protein